MTLAIIAGAGALPAALTAALPMRPFIAALDGFSPEGLTPDLTFRIERLYPFFQALHAAGVVRLPRDRPRSISCTAVRARVPSGQTSAT